MINDVLRFLNFLLLKISTIFGVKKLEQQTIIMLTEVTSNIVDVYIKKTDNKARLKEHIILVLNKILQKAKDMKITRNEAETLGKYLMRLQLIMEVSDEKKSTINEKDVRKITKKMINLVNKNV